MREQDIMEKFEFFPIKCRTQRALEVTYDPSVRVTALWYWWITLISSRHMKRHLPDDVGFGFPSCRPLV